MQTYSKISHFHNQNGHKIYIKITRKYVLHILHNFFHKTQSDPLPKTNSSKNQYQSSIFKAPPYKKYPKSPLLPNVNIQKSNQNTSPILTKSKPNKNNQSPLCLQNPLKSILQSPLLKINIWTKLDKTLIKRKRMKNKIINISSIPHIHT